MEARRTAIQKLPAPGIRLSRISSRCIQATLLSLVLGILGGDALALAQSTNLDDCGDGSAPMPLPQKAIGVCGLDTAHSMPYDGSKIIPFSIRSCWADWEGNEWSMAYCHSARRYTIEVDGPTTGGQFALTGPGGSIPIELTFSHPSSGSGTLAPNIESVRFDGAANGVQTPVQFEISLFNQSGLPPGVYGGSFNFYLYQCDPWWEGGICKGTIANQTTQLSPPVAFTIEVTIPPRIRISGLQDMLINANPSGLTEAQQSFCVFSQGGAPFEMRADSANGSGNFVLAGVDNVNYETWVGSNPLGNLLQLNEGQASSQSWPGHLTDGCGSGENMRLVIRIQQSALANAQDSSYSDTLTLTVTLQ